jgi:hypothetical protein
MQIQEQLQRLLSGDFDHVLKNRPYYTQLRFFVKLMKADITEALMHEVITKLTPRLYKYALNICNNHYEFCILFVALVKYPKYVDVLLQYHYLDWEYIYARASSLDQWRGLRLLARKHVIVPLVLAMTPSPRTPPCIPIVSFVARDVDGKCRRNILKFL